MTVYTYQVRDFGRPTEQEQILLDAIWTLNNTDVGLTPVSVVRVPNQPKVEVSFNDTLSSVDKRKLDNVLVYRGLEEV